MTTLTLPPPLVPRTAAREQRPIGYSPEDLLIMPDGERYELVNGQLQEKPMSGLSSWVGAEGSSDRMPGFSVSRMLWRKFASRMPRSWRNTNCPAGRWTVICEWPRISQ
jgi:hypothetical protein